MIIRFGERRRPTRGLPRLLFIDLGDLWARVLWPLLRRVFHA
jgi:hypothetical protein